MNSTVIHITHCVDIALIARLFARFRGRYGALWISRATCDDDWQYIMEDWLEELSRFTLSEVRAAVNKTLTTYKDYPPTLGQLVDLCLKEAGTPEPNDVVRMMVARDFSHPLTKMIYDKIGSWALTNGKEEDIQRKTKEYYTDCLSDFHAEPKKAWAQLESFNAKPKELPPPSKIPSASERKGFRERMSEHQERLENLKLNCVGKPYREFDEKEINPNNRYFKPEVYAQYRAYLLSIPEEDVLILPAVYAYDRSRFISAKEQPEMLRKAGYIPTPQGNNFDSTRASGGPKKDYKNWADY
ncbi:MAG TPA: hypothetical protein ACFYDZ_00205 [Candidatus Brocadiaceae bacterium]